jgi:hypothetical protein
VGNVPIMGWVSVVEVKGTPVYLVRQAYGFDEQEGQADLAARPWRRSDRR